MSDPNPNPSESLSADQQQVFEKLSQLSESVSNRLKELDEASKGFEKGNKVFEDLLIKIEKATDNRERNNQQTLLIQQLNEKKEKIIKNLEDTNKSLEAEIGQIADPTEKRNLETALNQLKSNVTSLDKNLTTQIKEKTDKIKKAKQQDIRSLIEGGINQNIYKELQSTKKETENVATNVLSKSIPATITQQVAEKIGFDLQKREFNLNAGELGTALTSATAAIYSLGDRLKVMGINPTVSGIAVSPLQALSAPAVSIGKNIPEIAQSFAQHLRLAFSAFSGSSKALIALPMRMMDFAIKKGLEIKKDNYEFINKLEDLQNKFSGKSGIGKNFEKLNETLKETRRLVYAKGFEFEGRTSLYGALGDDLIRRQIEETGEIIKAMGPYAEMMSEAVTRNVNEADARVSDYYYKAKKLMNLSDEDILNLTNRAVALGKSFPDVFHEISKATSDAAKKFGLDFKLMSGDVLTLRKNITDFAHKSADELATVVANVRRMGVSMNDAMSVFNRVDSFETAATTAAQLNQTFGMVIDSMELLKAESPDEILQQYKDAFAMSGKSFETMNRFERSLILQQTGLSEQAAQAIFSLENAGKTYEEVMSDINQKDPTAEQIEHMAEMDHAIQRNYQVMSDYDGMLKMVAKTMNDHMFKNNEKLKNSFIGAADAAQNLNFEFSKYNVAGKGGVLENAIAPFTNKVDEISNIIKDENSILNPVKNLVGDMGVMLNGIQKGGEEGAKLIQTAAQNATGRFEGFYVNMLSQGTKIILNSVNAASQVLPSIATQAGKQLGNIPNQMQQVMSDPENQKLVVDFLKNLESGKSQILDVGAKAIDLGQKLYNITESEDFQKIYTDKNKGVLNKLMGIIQLPSVQDTITNILPTNTSTPTVIQPQPITPTVNPPAQTTSTQNGQTASATKDVQDLITALKTSNINITTQLKVDGKTLAEAVAKNGLIDMLTNPNISIGQNTLKTDAVNNKVGQLQRNAFGNA